MTRLFRTARWMLALGGAALLLHAARPSPAVGAARSPLRVRASEAFAPCLAPALEAFSRETGVGVVLDVGEPDPPGDADVVVGDDAELTRVLEGGVADLSTRFDLGALPWVLVVPERSPAQLSAALAEAERVHVLGGRVGRDARLALQELSPERIRVTRDPEELRQARYALVPRSLAGPGERRPAGVRPLIANAAAIAASRHPVTARQLLAYLRSPRGHAVLSSCLDDVEETDGSAASAVSGTTAYAASAVDWWLPECTLQHNLYNDPAQVLGLPNAENLGGKDLYRGFMSLGQGGFVTVDTGVSAIDGPGADVRVFQTTSSEPVTLYASTDPQGPFTLIGLRESCGQRTRGVYSNHCDFDLGRGPLAEARYFRIEDGEIYPCLAGDTRTEGADIDAIEILNQKP